MTAYHLDEVRSRVALLENRLRAILEAEETSARQFYSQRRQEEEAAEKLFENLDVELRSGSEKLKTELEAAKQEAEKEYAGKAAGAQEACARDRTRILEELQRAVDSYNKDLREANERMVQEMDEKIAGVGAAFARIEGRIAAMRSDADRLKGQIEGLLSACRERPDTEQTDRRVAARSGGAEQLAGEIACELAESAKLLESAQRDLWLRVGRRLSPFAAYALIVVAHASAAALLYWLKDAFVYLACDAGSLIVTFLFAFVLFDVVRRKVRSVAGPLFGSLDRAYALLDFMEKSTKQKLDRAREECLKEKVDSVSSAGQKTDALITARKARAAPVLASLDERCEALKGQLSREREAALAGIEGAFAEKKRLLAGQHEGNLKRLQEEISARKEDRERKRAKDIETLTGEWTSALDGFSQSGREMVQCSRRHHPAWADPLWRNWTMSKEFPDSVYAGDIRVNLKTLDIGRPEGSRFSLPAESAVVLPLALSFPKHGSLLLSAGPGKRDEALQTLFNTTLRLMSAFPPGKAKLTIVDPVGLGQSFSALMHLSDYDESLVGGRIWTDPSHIEKELADLAEHIEKVIQKYLRNRYASIGEYNREAGEMAEAYHFLVIADFPTGFSELALNRLASIASSGVRCGVYTLIAHDKKQKFPREIGLPELRRNGPVLVAGDEGFSLDDEGLKGAAFLAEKPPDSRVITELLQTIGEQYLESKRVEVPFEAATPKPEEFWSASAEIGIRVPLGRSGADRLQFLDLGRGTSQHALVAGKTGSGKSTLFHVMITNLAMWYSPREVEFYLIDFKKGVEFKLFADGRLPHARVIAIESDRQFGLSVLRRIDAEFDHRAELFRKAGVQDLASFRKSGAEEYLPRTLLLIDEFQEFFIEDDATAQDAALLLDRIVRQGRAFGVHVVLGSQTLGGAYTLAKSTLGQMAVRIALQCNEADSYLILSDDNAAARLLSRPGEAIYNDMSGAVEGNNPFQIVWLPDETERACLGQILRRAEREGWQPGEQTVVFEGNVPADLGRNLLLKRLLSEDSVPARDAGERVWCGEANAIKGPTEVCFRRQAGSNLLMVGQRSLAAAGMFSSAVFSLTAAHAPADLRIVILDGSTPESGHGEHLQHLAQALPHVVTLAEYRDVPQIMGDLQASVKARQEGNETADKKIFLMIFGLQRFRNLRQTDEFEFSGDEGGKPSAGKCFSDVLTEGPGQGVHSIIWCDSLGNVNRSLSRKALQEFGMRILFQMSATDSSELIDMPLASKLGLYRALLFIEEDGTVETFRPYAIPDAAMLEELRGRLLARSGS